MDNIPFTVLCDDWKIRRSFSTAIPMMAAASWIRRLGQCWITILQKLNEEYNKGIVDQEFFTQNYQEYLQKLASGRVLGMVDQWGQFAYAVNGTFAQGCGYVPLPITTDRSTKNQWHVKLGAELSAADGISITVSYENIEGAMKFINDLLDEEILKLRYWVGL